MGGHGAHGHHEEPYKVPDYRIYKLENAPLLQKTQRALQAQGLSDPWIRNEIWRYDEKIFGKNAWTRSCELFFGPGGRSFKLGFGAFVVTAALTAIYDRVTASKHGGHGGHDGGDHH